MVRSRAFTKPPVAPNLAFDRAGLAAFGFDGFVTFVELWNMWLDLVPRTAGVYAVLRESDEPPEFRSESPGGRFKGRDPTAPIETLGAMWVDGVQALYFGKAEDLQRRLRQYARFGKGEPVGHWGGRYIWQLADSADLVVAWKRCDPSVSARSLESELLHAFVDSHGALPFANIAR